MLAKSFSSRVRFDPKHYPTSWTGKRSILFVLSSYVGQTRSIIFNVVIEYLTWKASFKQC